MDYLGLFSLGCFVGTIATLGVKFMKDAATWKKGSIRVLGWLHLVGVILASLGALALVVPPAVLAAWKICQPTP